MALLPKFSAERTDFSGRLVETLASAHGLAASPTVVAREFNFRFTGKPVTVHAVRKWLLGEAIPTQDKLRALASWLDVSLEWLRFGGAQARQPAGAEPGCATAASPVASIVKLLMSLPHRDRQLAKQFIAMLGQKITEPVPSVSRIAGATRIAEGPADHPVRSTHDVAQG